MPRLFSVTCAYCGETRHRVPGITQPIYCSRECYDAALEREIEARIGEPLVSAIARLYVFERRSYREITKLLGINRRTLMRKMKKYGIAPRKGGEAVVTQWEGNPERRTKQSARFARIRHTLRGQQIHNWAGGVSFKYVMPVEEWRTLCDRVRSRDGYRCTRCGMANAEHFKRYCRRLEVHHIVPYRLSGDNSLDNLTSLCLHCHRTREAEFKWLL